MTTRNDTQKAQAERWRSLWDALARFTERGEAAR